MNALTLSILVECYDPKLSRLYGLIIILTLDSDISWHFIPLCLELISTSLIHSVDALKMLSVLSFSRDLNLNQTTSLEFEAVTAPDTQTTICSLHPLQIDILDPF